MKIGNCLFVFLWLINTATATNLEPLVHRNLAKADSLKLAYDYQLALDLLDTTLHLVNTQLGEKDTIIAAIYYQQAEVLYYTKKEEAALAKAKLAFNIQQKKLPRKNAKTATTAYFIGLLYQRLKDMEKAKVSILEAINLTPVTDPNLYYRYRKKALEGFPKNALESIRIGYWLATSLGKTQQIQAAKQYFKTTKTICQAQRKRFPKERRYLVELHALRIREAAFYTAIGLPTKAISIYEKIVKEKAELSLKQKDFFWTYSVQKTTLHFDYTKVFREAGDIRIDYQFSSAEENVTNCACKAGVASTFEKTAKAYAQLNNYDQAFTYFQKAITVLVPDFKAADLYELPIIQNQAIGDKQLLVQVLASFSKAIQQKYTGQKKIVDLKKAVAVYQTIDTLTTLTRQRLTVADARYKILETTKKIYENAIQTTLSLFEVTKEKAYLEIAYQFSAKNKAIVLLDGLQNEQAKIAAGISGDILEEERQLKKQYNKLEAAILETDEADRKEQLFEALFKVKIKYNQLVNQLETDYPAYYELKYAFTNPLTIAEIQQQLPDSTLLLEYFLGEEQLFIFSMDKLNFQHTIISLPSGFRDACSQYLTLLDSGTDMPKNDYSKLAYQLYEVLLKQPLVAAKQPIHRLMIIPDDVLIPLSFATFLTQPTTKWLGRKNPYLLQDYAVSYAYANQLLFDEKATERVNLALKEFGGFGIEYHEETTFIKTENKATNPVLNRSIGALPNSDEEVLSIHQLLNGFSWMPLNLMKAIPLLRRSVWINEEATKANFIKYAKDYKILHLAMHGLLANENPLSSALLFSPNVKEENNSLKAAELYNMKLHAEMVVLGACDTGRGKINKGEGIRSLARVFTYIGCPSLVASLWKASDEATKKIMLPFYENLAQNQPKDIALQKAQIQYLNAEHPELAAPSFWGHLALIGDAKPIEITPVRPYWMYVFLLFPILFLGSIYLKKKN